MLLKTFVGIGRGCGNPNPQEFLWVKPETQNRLNLRQAGNTTSILTVDGATGNVGIGTASPVHRLEVCGTIRASEVQVRANWCDYVFEPTYNLRPLDELQAFIRTHKHLPEIPTQKTVETEGLDLGAMQTLHMKKIEELTLYILRLHERLQKLEQTNK